MKSLLCKSLLSPIRIFKILKYQRFDSLTNVLFGHLGNQGLQVNIGLAIYGLGRVSLFRVRLVVGIIGINPWKLKLASQFSPGAFATRTSWRDIAIITIFICYRYLLRYYILLKSRKKHYLSLVDLGRIHFVIFGNSCPQNVGYALDCRWLVTLFIKIYNYHINIFQ